MINLELHRKKVKALEIMRKRNFQSSTIIQVIEDAAAIDYLLKNPNDEEINILTVAQTE